MNMARTFSDQRLNARFVIVTEPALAISCPAGTGFNTKPAELTRFPTPEWTSNLNSRLGYCVAVLPTDW